MSCEISNLDDVIDSRDVIERIAELEDEREDIVARLAEHETEEPDSENEQDEHDTWYHHGEHLKQELSEWDADYAEELAALKNLAEQCEGYGDWSYGETLIRDTYFKDYAQELAVDCDMLRGADQWPLRHIDWDAAARELKYDYTSVDFDGVEYWMRS